MARSRTKAPASTPGAFRSLVGVHRVGEWWYWVAYLDARDAFRGKAPDYAGWSRLGSAALDVGADLLGKALGLRLNVGEQDARAWLASNGGSAVVARADEVAAGCWLGAHRPQPPVVAGEAPPQPVAERPWWVAVLACPWQPTRGEVTAAYRIAARAAHPDAPGGSKSAFQRVQRAHEAALGWLADREERGGG